jgi:hypothetical protein
VAQLRGLQVVMGTKVEESQIHRRRRGMAQSVVEMMVMKSD